MSGSTGYDSAGRLCQRVRGLGSGYGRRTYHGLGRRPARGHPRTRGRGGRRRGEGAGASGAEVEAGAGASGCAP
jgi:hypothetical protein